MHQTLWHNALKIWCQWINRYCNNSLHLHWGVSMFALMVSIVRSAFSGHRAAQRCFRCPRTGMPDPRRCRITAVDLARAGLAISRLPVRTRDMFQLIGYVLMSLWRHQSIQSVYFKHRSTSICAGIIRSSQHKIKLTRYKHDVVQVFYFAEMWTKQFLCRVSSVKLTRSLAFSWTKQFISVRDRISITLHLHCTLIKSPLPCLSPSGVAATCQTSTSVTFDQSTSHPEQTVHARHSGRC